MPNKQISFEDMVGDDPGPSLAEQLNEPTGEVSFEDMVEPETEPTVDIGMGEATAVDKMKGLRDKAKDYTPTLSSIGASSYQHLLGVPKDDYDANVKLKNPLDDKEVTSFGEEFSEAWQTFGNLAQNPMELMKGLTNFALAIPGFTFGVAKGVQNVARVIGQKRTFDFKDLYEAASEGMSDTMGVWTPMVQPAWLTPTKESEMAGSAVMAPALGVMQLFSNAARPFAEDDSEWGRNAYGLLRFAGDIGGLATLHRVMRGPKHGPSAGEKIHKLAKEARDIIDTEMKITELSEERIKQAEMAVLDARKKIVLDDIKGLKAEIDKAFAIKEDVKVKAEEISKKKQEPVDVGMAEEIVEEIQGKLYEEGVKLVDTPEAEPIIKVDEMGPRELPVSDTFRQNSERTQQLHQEFESRKWREDIELTTQKMINDVNRWLDGDDTVAIDEARNMLSTLSTRANELRSQFDRGEYWMSWREVVDQAASWARRAERGADGETLSNKIGRSDVSPEEASASLQKIKALEDAYGKKIDKISDKEIEAYFAKESETGIDWFGEGREKVISNPDNVADASLKALPGDKKKPEGKGKKSHKFSSVVTDSKKWDYDGVEQLEELKPFETEFTLDKTNLLPTLLKDISNQNPSKTMIYELMQNSLDAILDPKGEIVIKTVQRKKGSELSFRDSGKGMTPEEVKEFFLVGGSEGKSGVETRGGYGLAKIALLLIPEKIKLTTWKDGVKSVVKATREDIYDGTVTITPTREKGQGTLFECKLPDKLYDHNLGSWEMNCAVDNVLKGTFSDTKVVHKEGEWFSEDGKVEWHTKTKRPPSRLDDMPKKTETKRIHLDGSDIAIHYLKVKPYGSDWSNSGNFVIEGAVTNKGLAVDINVNRVVSGRFPEQPDFNVIVDFEKTPGIRDGNYPFLKNRTMLGDKWAEAIQKITKKDIRDIRLRIVEERGADFGGMVAASPEYNGVKVLIPYKGEAYRQALRIVEENRPIIGDFTDILGDFKGALEAIGEPGINFHITIDPKVFGYRSNKKLTGHDIYAINPFAMSAKYLESSKLRILVDKNERMVEMVEEPGITGGKNEVTRMQADNMTHTMVHEFTHLKVWDHNESYTTELAKLTVKIGHEKLNQLRKRLEGFYDYHGSNIEGLAESFEGLSELGDGLTELGGKLSERRTQSARKEGLQDLGRWNQERANSYKPDAGLSEAALALKKKFGRVKPHVENPFTDTPITKFRIRPGGMHNWETEFSGAVKKARERGVTEEGLDSIRPGKWKPNTELVKSQGYLIDGWDPIAEEWVWMDTAENHVQSKQLLKLWNERLKADAAKTNVVELFTGFPIHKLFKRSKKGEVTVNTDNMTEGQKTAWNLGKAFQTQFDKSVAKKKFNLDRFLKKLGFHTYRMIHEKKGLIRGKMLKQFGEEGWHLINRMDAEEGGSGYGQLRYEAMCKEAFGGLSSRLEEVVHRYNLAERFKDIYSYKTTKEYQSPPGYGRQQVAVNLALFDVYNKLTKEEFKLVKERSDIVFKHHKMWVDDLVEAGLKSAEEGEALKSHNYRKIKDFSLESLFDDKFKKVVGEKKVAATDSGVDPLGRGGLSLVEPNARVVASETANRVYRRCASQEAKNSWQEFAERNPGNPFVWYKGMKDANGKAVKQPKGWVRDFRYENGERKAIYFEPATAQQIMSVGPDTSYRFSKVVSHLMAVPAVRFLAVGSSASWALTVGLMMDIAHTFFVPRYWDSKKGKQGGFRRPYSWMPHAFAWQLGKHMSKTAGDAALRGPKYKTYIKHGGSMPFLTQRKSHFTSEGVKLPGKTEKVLDAMSYIGKSVELWNRISVMDRMMEIRARERGITIEEAYKNKDLCYEAAGVARERMPYGQGGWLTKACDTLFFPFTSAGYVGLRTLLRAPTEMPGDFLLRFTSLGIGAAGITMASWLNAPHVKKGIPDYVNHRNITIPLFPNWLSFKDNEGNDRYFYLKVPVDPGTALFYNLAKGLTEKLMYEKGMIDHEPDYRQITGTLKKLSPIQGGLPPNLEAFYGYITNHSVWKDRSMFADLGGRSFDWPDSQHEGVNDPNVSAIAKDVGKVTKLSPKRLHEASRSVMPSGNEYIYAMGKAYEIALGDVDPRAATQHFAMTLSEIPGIKRIIGITVPRAHRTQPRDDLKDEQDVVQFLRNSNLDTVAENYYWWGVGSLMDAEKMIANQKEKSLRISMRKKVKFIRDIKSLGHRTSWSSMFNATPEVKGADFYDMYQTASDEERVALRREMDTLGRLGYTSRRFWKEYERLTIQKAKRERARAQ
jgi:hypothetical protein